MILSVSRRTDIPNYYSEWFYNRIKEGFLYVRNPMNDRQISRIDLSPQVVDCIVFWTKNPADMLPRLEELHGYQYYFQFTLTGYGRDIEPNLPDKRTELIDTFKKLSEKIGKDRVIWRYDPILVNRRYTLDYHLKAFGEIAASLKGYTEKAVISFLDLYEKTQRNMAGIGVKCLSAKEMAGIAKNLAGIAERNQLTVETCAEQIELQDLGVRHGSCIDRELIEKIVGCRLNVKKDKNQRNECRCIESIDVGAYNTCKNACKYCYANFSNETVRGRTSLYDANSPLLCGRVGPDDKVTVRKVQSLKEQQMCWLNL